MSVASVIRRGLGTSPSSIIRAGFGEAEAPATNPPVITSTLLDSLFQGVAFSQQLTATGATPITWSGTPPGGLTLDSSGLLSGTPSSAAPYSFTVTATNADGSDDQLFVGAIETPGGGGLAPRRRRRRMH